MRSGRWEAQQCCTAIGLAKKKLCSENDGLKVLISNFLMMLCNQLQEAEMKIQTKIKIEFSYLKGHATKKKLAF